MSSRQTMTQIKWSTWVNGGISQNDISNRETIMGNLWSALISHQTGTVLSDNPTMFWYPGSQGNCPASIPGGHGGKSLRCNAKSELKVGIENFLVLQATEPNHNIPQPHITTMCKAGSAKTLQLSWDSCSTYVSRICPACVVVMFCLSRDKQVAGLSPTCLLEFFEQ